MSATVADAAREVRQVLDRGGELYRNLGSRLGRPFRRFDFVGWRPDFAAHAVRRVTWRPDTRYSEAPPRPPGSDVPAQRRRPQYQAGGRRMVTGCRRPMEVRGPWASS